jgi:hypothetical protein
MVLGPATATWGPPAAEMAVGVRVGEALVPAAEGAALWEVGAMGAAAPGRAAE